MSSLKAVKDAIFPHISVMGSDPFCDPTFLRYKCATRILRPNSLCDVYHWFIGILRNAEGRPHADHFLKDRGATVKVVPLFVYGGVVFIMGPDDWTYGKRKKVCRKAYLLLCS